MSDSNTITSNNVSLGVILVEGRDESVSGVRSSVGFSNREFQEFVRRLRSSVRTEPSPSVITRDRVGITNIAIGSKETSRTSLIGDQTSLTNISSDFCGISIMDQKLESVGVRRDQWEFVEIPSDFNTIVVQIRRKSNSGRIDESEWGRISSKT